MTPEQVAYELTVGCPGCGGDVEPDELCGCDDPDTGPLCINRCCPREHRQRQPWEVAVA